MKPNDILNELRNTKPSVLFWNSAGIVAVLLVGLLFGWVFSCLIWAFASILSLSIVYEDVFENIGTGQDKRHKLHLWVWLTPTLWMFAVLGMVLFASALVLAGLYRRIIVPFNKRLDGDKNPIIAEAVQEDDNTLYAPFSSETVEALKQYQALDMYHEYTCDSRVCPQQQSGTLIPTESGWVCPCGEYTQNWCSKSLIDLVKLRNSMDQ